MSTRLRLEPKHHEVAAAIAKMPHQDTRWTTKAACGGANYGEGLDGGEDAVLKRKLDRYFIGKFCDVCPVAQECFIQGVQLEVTDAVRGGQSSLELARYTRAYQLLQAGPELDKMQPPPGMPRQS